MEPDRVRGRDGKLFPGKQLPARVRGRDGKSYPAGALGIGLRQAYEAAKQAEELFPEKQFPDRIIGRDGKSYPARRLTTVAARNARESAQASSPSTAGHPSQASRGPGATSGSPDTCPAAGRAELGRTCGRQVRGPPHLTAAAAATTSPRGGVALLQCDRRGYTPRRPGRPQAVGKPPGRVERPRTAGRRAGRIGGHQADPAGPWRLGCRALALGGPPAQPTRTSRGSIEAPRVPGAAWRAAPAARSARFGPARTWLRPGRAAAWRVRRTRRPPRSSRGTSSAASYPGPAAIRASVTGTPNTAGGIGSHQKEKCHCGTFLGGTRLSESVCGRSRRRAREDPIF